MLQTKNLKIVLIGDRNVGKRSLITKAFESSPRLSSFYIPIEFSEIEGKDQNGPVKLFFYDSLIKGGMISSKDRDMYCEDVISNAHAVIMCFALNDVHSLANLLEWHNIIKPFLNRETKIYMAGTKSDSIPKVDEEIIDAVRSQLGPVVECFNTSSITGKNVDALFTDVLSNFVKFPFIMKDSGRVFGKREEVPISKGMVTPHRRNISQQFVISTRDLSTTHKRNISHDMNTSLDYVTPQKRTIMEEILAPQSIISEGGNFITRSVPIEVHGAARGPEIGTENSLMPRSSVQSFAKQEKMPSNRQFQFIAPIKMEHDDTELEFEMEIENKHINDDFVDRSFLEREDFCLREDSMRVDNNPRKDDSLQVEILYRKEEPKKEENKEVEREYVPSVVLNIEDKGEEVYMKTDSIKTEGETTARDRSYVDKDGYYMMKIWF